MNLELARFNMIEQQILPYEVIAPALVTALFKVQREHFVAAEFRQLALAGTQLPLGHGEVMLLPEQEARLINALRLVPGEKVLEVGAGSGYVAAVLGQLAGQVSAIEQHADLVANARARLASAGIGNVAVHEGEGLIGLPGDAPFDAILLSGALPEAPPRALLEQLKIGGRMIAIVGAAPVMQVQRITRLGQNDWQTESVFQTIAPYLRTSAGVRFEF